MITEIPVSGIDNKPIIVKKKPVPQSTNKALPMLFNTQMYVGKKGMGKSYKFTKLLKMYEESDFIDSNGIKYDMRTILISPTSHSGANAIFNTIKTLDPNDIYTEYSEDLLLSIMDDIKSKNDTYQEYLEYKKIYDKFIKVKTINGMTLEELQILELNDFMKPEDLYGKLKPFVVFLILDDLVGTNAYSRKRASALNNLVIKHRHMCINLIFTSQSYKQIPVIIRNNIDIFAVFKTGSDIELKKIFEDISGYISYDEFINLYEYATQEKNDALIIINNSMTSKGTQYYRNWDIELIYKKN